ncbi:MAG: hypothetical protein VX012_08800, partial [Planctomycetota bacterium]|nr:hypothetical protein [Planctomycetota bacterium]
VCFGDGHVEYSKSFYPTNVSHECGLDAIIQDNIFVAEFDTCGSLVGNWKQGDAWLAMNEVVTDGGGGDPKPLAIYDANRPQ